MNATPTDQELWSPPVWMKPLLRYITNTGGGDPVKMYNGHANPLINLPLSTLQACVKSQISLLYALDEVDYLKEPLILDQNRMAILDSSLQEQIHRFHQIALGPSLNRGWMEFSQGSLYIRTSRRLILGRMRSMVDIANIEIKREFRGRGIFTQILILMQSLPYGDGVLVENVLNERLCATLVRRASNDPEHWQIIPGPSFAWVRP